MIELWNDSAYHEDSRLFTLRERLLENSQELENFHELKVKTLLDLPKPTTSKTTIVEEYSRLIFQMRRKALQALV